LIYTIALSAIVLPALVLLCVSSIPAGRFDLTALRTAAGRGEFLIPVFILCAETIRCWTFEAKPATSVGRSLRNMLCAACIVTGVVCFTATVTAAALTVTASTSRSLELITIYGMGIATVCGFIAVIAVSGAKDTK
jgi:hypothetical protein